MIYTHSARLILGAVLLLMFLSLPAAPSFAALGGFERSDIVVPMTGVRVSDLEGDDNDDDDDDDDDDTDDFGGEDLG